VVFDYKPCLIFLQYSEVFKDSVIVSKLVYCIYCKFPAYIGSNMQLTKIIQIQIIRFEDVGRKFSREGGATKKDRKIALLSLFQGGQRKKTEK